MRKNYILDANILLHDPQSVLHFADNVVIIPVGVIREIDRFKKEMSDRGHNARAVVRLLDSLRAAGSLAEGVALPGGGRLRVVCGPDGAGAGGADTELLRLAEQIRQREPDVPVVIVTKDINLRIRADAAGLRAEDYESDRVRLSELESDVQEHALPRAAFEALRDGQRVPLGGAGEPNRYLTVRPDDGGPGCVLARVSPGGDALRPLCTPRQGVLGVRPRNREQHFALDALLDEELELVTLMGKAGTGKTLLAVAAGLAGVFERRRYRGLVVCRPIVPMGRDLGYLPGDVREKLDPWMKPVLDTLEYLLDVGAPLRGVRDLAGLLRSGAIELEPLTYIRGRNIAHRFVIIDEAQNLTPLEVKTVITRIGEQAKVVLTGDPWQIDNPYVDAASNGFAWVVQRFRAQPLAAHVVLHRGERSRLAELAANLL